MVKLKVIGLATDVNVQVKNWVEGMKYAGLSYKLLGAGEKFTGWKMRSELYLKEFSESDADIFIVSDVYDVLVNQKVVRRIEDSGKTVEEYILSTFYQFKKPIVIGAEKGCFIHQNCHSYSFRNTFSFLENDYKFPNAGLLIGERSHMIDLYRRMIDHSNDQLRLGELYVKYPRNFDLDKNSKLFYNFSVYPSEKRFKTAIFVHFPGLKTILTNRVAYNQFNNYKPILLVNQDSLKIGISAVLFFAIIIGILYWIYLKMDNRRIHDISYHLFL